MFKNLYKAAQIDERVTAGAAWLDTLSDHWHEAVNIDDIDMRNGNQCILGQTFLNRFGSDALVAETASGFQEGVIRLLGGSFEKAAAYGFNSMEHMRSWDQTPEYQELTVESGPENYAHLRSVELDLLAIRWIQEIESRWAGSD